MMTYEIYRYIFIGATVLTIIMFIITVLVFILLNIPMVIGDLTGANARKAIENIRTHNENTGDKTYRSSHVNRERGKLTDKISASGNLIKNPSNSLHGAMATAKISTQKLPPVDDMTENTTVLESEHHEVYSETTVISQEPADNYSQTTLLSDNSGYINGETTLLSDDLNDSVNYNETTLLAPSPTEAVFCIEYEITYIHTDEIIPEE